MATFQRTATANGADNGWNGLVGAAQKYLAVQSNDDATSYIANTGFAHDRQSFVMSAMPDAESISTHTITGRGMNLNSPFTTDSWALSILLAGSHTDSGFWNESSWTTHTLADGAVPGGGTWTSALINSAEPGVFHGNTNGVEQRLSYLVWDITYAPPGFSFISLLSLLGPLIGAGLTLAEMPRLAGALRARTPHGLERHEIEAAWREWRAHRFARHVLLGA